MKPSSTTHRWTLAMAVAALAGCGFGKEARQELIQDELRSLGVSANPLISTPSVAGKPPNTVELTYVAAVPLGTTATITPFRDSAASSSGAVVLDESAVVVETGAGKQTYKAYNQLQILTATVTVTLPEITAFADQTLGGQVEYGLAVTAAGRTENVIGDLLVVPPGSSQSNFSNLSVAITTPAADGGVLPVGGDNDIEATVTNPNNENVVLGWFVTDGQVANRRADSTTWTAPDAAAQTLIIVAHGVQSRGFDYQVRQVTTK